MNKFKKISLEKLSTDLINLIVFALGLILILIAFFIIDNNDLNTILISVGTSLLASSIVLFLSSRYLLHQGRIKEIINIWGLKAIYETRAAMNESSNKQLDILNEKMDIIAFGLRSFRDAKGDLIEKKVRRGVKLRILTIDPQSSFLKQREKDENKNIGDIKRTIIDLGDWVEKLKEKGDCDCEIKYYNSLPLDSYLREDDKVYIGPYIYGKVSQQTISYEFEYPSRGFQYYSDYFEKLWKDESFSRKKVN